MALHAGLRVQHLPALHLALQIERGLIVRDDLLAVAGRIGEHLLRGIAHGEVRVVQQQLPLVAFDLTDPDRSVFDRLHQGDGTRCGRDQLVDDLAARGGAKPLPRGHDQLDGTRRTARGQRLHRRLLQDG